MVEGKFLFLNRLLLEQMRIHQTDLPENEV